jgi:hypothetical protein
MDFNTTLGIVGIAISLMFGVWGLFLVVKYRSGHLTFVREQTIALFDSIVKNLPELAVLYRDSQITPNLVLIKGAFVNTGRKDISPQMIESPLTVFLPKGFSWLTAKVISSSHNVNASIQIDSNGNLQVKSGLLRCREFIRFQALAEVPPDVERAADQQLIDALRFSHRIQDTRPIRTIELKESKRVKKRMRRFLVLPIISIFAVIGYIVHPNIATPTKHFAYKFKKDSVQTITVIAYPRTSSTVLVEDLDNFTYQKVISFDEFLRNCQGIPVIVERGGGWGFLLASFLLYVVMPLFFFTPPLRDYLQNRQLSSMLSSTTKGHKLRTQSLVNG